MLATPLSSSQSRPLPFWRIILAVRRKRRARERLIAALAAHGERSLAFPASWGSAVVHRDTHPGRVGKWRATWLDSEGEPTGHAEADDFEGALLRAIAEGAEMACPVEIQRAA